MAKHKEEKTNVMRLLEQRRIPYTPHTYPHGAQAPDGVSVARSLGQDPAAVFKTLVTCGASGGYYVFDIPVADTLDLKKAARAVGEKRVEMLPSRQLLPLTAYVHGGCLEQEHIFVSAGKVGVQVEVSPQALLELVGAGVDDLVVSIGQKGEDNHEVY